MKIAKNTLEFEWKILFLWCNWMSFIVAFSFYLDRVECQIIPSSSVATLLNENGTLFYSTLTNEADATKTPFKHFTDPKDDVPWRCLCSSEQQEELEMKTGEIECHCEGLPLKDIPQNLFNFTRLSVVNTQLKVLKEIELRKYAAFIKDIALTNLNEFYKIEPTAFKDIRHLRALEISHAPKLHFIAKETFQYVSHSFKILRIVDSGLKKIPNLSFLQMNSKILQQLDFEGNQISEISENSIHIRTEQLIIDFNLLKVVERAAFNGSEIGKLSLKGNTKLRLLHERAFEGIKSIRELDLSSTNIESLPTLGLDKLETLRIQNTRSLKHIPSVYNFQNLEKAWLTHSFHCCAFDFPHRHDPTSHERHLQLIESFKNECKNKGYTSTTGDSFGNINYSSKAELSLQRRRRSNFYMTKAGNVINNKTREYIPYHPSEDEQEATENDDFELDSEGEFHPPVTIEKNATLEAMCGTISLNSRVRKVQCFPKPDALNPCEDVMGSSWLRASVWIVVSLAVIGNVAVLVVLLSFRSEFTVPKFLMCNLALADFCMGIYLLLIASIDLHSMGEYFNLAFDWQYGMGCKTAGWLTVFAGHLSIFTLTIITVERWFAITHAIYLNKRLKHRTAIYIMICGWLYSIIMAIMPLYGISNYSSTSICLPMEAKDPADVIYLITVLAVNGLGFFIVVICYAQIYFSLGKETRQRGMGNGRSEMTVAKKMALLVFTNFACWAPIAFFGLTALAGYPLINVTKSKILLVFFYPINSCANPYLYAILTSQYRRDLFQLLSKFGIFTQRAQRYRMNYSNPTHTIPLNMLSSVRNSNSMNFNYRHTNSNMKSNAERLLITDNNMPVMHNDCHTNGKIDVNLCEDS